MNSKKDIFLTVVIPVFNEQKRISNLPKIIDFFSKQKLTTRIIVVNDGSTDQTQTFLKNFQKKYQFNLITYSKNQGKGYALKQGILKSKSRFILFTDIDLSTPLSEFLKIQPYLKSFDLVIATRKIGQSKLLKRQGIVRENLGKGFTILSNLILGLNISDFTCGFKCFSQKSAMDIFSHLTINRWGFDPEVLFIAHKRHYKIKEVAVNWENDPHSKVKFPGDILSSMMEILKIHLNNLRGLYE